MWVLLGTSSQTAFCFRFLENKNVHVELLQFVPVTDMIRKGLANAISKTINNLNFKRSSWLVKVRIMQQL